MDLDGRRLGGAVFRARAARWLWAMLAVYAVAGLALLGFRGELRITLATIPWWVVPAFMAFASVGFAARTWRWLVLARAAGLAVPGTALAGVYVGGFLMNLTPAHLGELWRVWVLRHGWGQRYRRTMPLMICDRVLDLAAVLLFAAVAAGPGLGLGWLAIPCLLAACMLFAPMLLPGWSRNAVKVLWAATGRRRTRLFALALSVCRNVARLGRPAVLAKLLPLSLLAWSMEALALHLLMPAVGGQLSLPAALASLGLGILAGAITLLPAGVGGQELIMTLLIGTASGNSTDAAIAMVAIMRLSTLWYATALGLPFFLYLSRHVSRRATARRGPV